MTRSLLDKPPRRQFLAGSAALLSSPALAEGVAQDEDVAYDPLRPPPEPEPPVKRNISAFRAKNWRPYFDNLRKGAILVDIDSRALHYWSEDESVYKLFPSSVPLSDDLTRRGRPSVIRKVDGPSWSPTPNMLKRNPESVSYTHLTLPTNQHA